MGKSARRTWTEIRRDRLAGMSAEQLRSFRAGYIQAATAADSSAPIFRETAWHGGYYELALVLGGVTDAGSDDRLSAAIHASWSHDLCFGPFGDRLFTATSSTEMLDRPGEIAERLYGALLLPYGVAPLTTIIVREEHGDDNLDWLYIACPMGGLAEIHEGVGGYPFEPDTDGEDWQEPLDSVLLDLAQHVRTAAPFDRAYIDFEVSGNDSATAAEFGSLFVRGRKVPDQ